MANRIWNVLEITDRGEYIQRRIAESTLRLMIHSPHTQHVRMSSRRNGVHDRNFEHQHRYRASQFVKSHSPNVWTVVLYSQRIPSLALQ